MNIFGPIGGCRHALGSLVENVETVVTVETVETVETV